MGSRAGSLAALRSKGEGLGLGVQCVHKERRQDMDHKQWMAYQAWW